MNARAANSVYHSLNDMLEPSRPKRFIQNGTRGFGARREYSVLDTLTMREHHFFHRECVDRLINGLSHVEDDDPGDEPWGDEPYEAE